MSIDTGISKSQVSHVCARLDERVGACGNQTLCHGVSRAVVVATGITADDGRDVVGVEVGGSEDETFWAAFLGSLKARGLSGVCLVIPDAPARLTDAIRKCWNGTGWQRCRVHYARNLLAGERRCSQEMVPIDLGARRPS